ncbi:MAG: hypothetical protein Q4C58_11360 [Eubacteriales bacterium]|nr:hypothetical protein [Eubacteriales bacterium]
MKIKVNKKSVSGKKSGIRQVVYEYPKCPATVKELLEETVKLCVADYNSRREAGTDILQVFSGAELEDRAAAGKIAFGVNYGTESVQEKEAVENALQCFEDGIVAAFVDGVRLEKPEDPLTIKENSEVTFVRLTMLAGRMW